MKILHWISILLIIIGGLNWGLVGLLHLNLITHFFGPMSLLSRLIYILIGLAAVFTIYYAVKSKHGCKCCKKSEAAE
ncbi:MAG: DUF378 domain-containing protein [Gammaproteobacteria bacterium]|nr:DUF378 domain-containing protein [Gammaproteobacteria bacterium]